MSSFQGKTVIVTGCSSGMGLATTLLFLSRKAQVFGIDISPFKHDLNANQSASFVFHQIDLCTPNAAETAVALCQAKFGPRIDVLANVAGIMDKFASADTVQESDWDRVIMINLTVPVRMMKAVLGQMKEQKSGVIVNVGSHASHSGASAGVAYTASKHGLAGATKNVAWRFRKDGIRCNAVLPGGKGLPHKILS
jgi:NAD(P)-dependent dehydrogenase (short-subunit alcohol dehydrogenase family)